MHLIMSTLINFNYYLFCMQQLSAKEQQIWSEEDLASFRRTVDEYKKEKSLTTTTSEYNMEDLLVIPKLERTMTVETPFLENELTGEISDLNGQILATYRTQEERSQMYSILIKKYQLTSANKTHS